MDVSGDWGYVKVRDFSDFVTLFPGRSPGGFLVKNRNHQSDLVIVS